jgi:DNA helicase-2/ATP-dependent DNA helicase PcrA
MQRKKIESLTRTLEAADFYSLYEDTKTQRGAIDYNDVLTLMVRVAHESEDAVAAIRERFLYVLIDEHQDSSGVQNAFLEAVWKEVEQPNLFVVGDDRQLIYGFGGASLAYFESFKHTFGKATLITLTHNYRSTQTILDSAEALLQSTLAQGKLVGSDTYTHPLTLVTCDYPRDEIIAAGMSFKQALADGVDPNQCALLVPKNRHVKTAVMLLQDMGLPVAAASAVNLFDLPETHTLLAILRIIAQPHDSVAVAASIVDPLVGVDPLVAHEYLYKADTRNLSVSALLQADHASISQWGVELSTWINEPRNVYETIQVVGEKVLLEKSVNDEVLRRRVEVIRTLLHLALSHIESSAQSSLAEFVASIDRMIEYGEDIPLAVFGAELGIKVLTLHGSKGLEFEQVWIAHMDERSLMSSKRNGFVLPQSIAHIEQEVQEEVAKRQLYVAITRAKYKCTISYALESLSGASQQLASIIESLPSELLRRETYIEPSDLKQYVTHTDRTEPIQPDALIDLVRETYAEKKVSVTLLNNFFECPWKWYFRSLLQLPEAMTDSIHIGNITHKTIEYVLNKKTTDRSTTAIAHYIRETAITEAHYDEVVAARYAHHVEKVIEQWMRMYYPELVAPYDIEKNIAYRDPDFAHLSIVGKVDVVEEIITGEVRVTDWKTGGVKTSTEIEKSDDAGHMSGLLRQLAMYSYLIHGQSKGNLEVSESRLVFIEAKKGDKHAVHLRKITTDDIERLRTELQEYDTLLKNGEWITQPCRTKLYGNETECPYCARARLLYAVDTAIHK